jgi:hypothetical protein
MNIATQLTSLTHLARWIDDNTKGIEISGDQRQQIAAACFDVAIEHQAAIIILCSSQLFGSMFSMLRVLTESVTRGLWLLHCATEAELKRFKKHGIDKPFGILTKEVEASIEIKGDSALYSTPWIKQVKKGGRLYKYKLN